MLLPYGTHMAMPRNSWLRRAGLALDIFKIAASQKIVGGALEVKLASHRFSGLVYAHECEENTYNTCVHTHIYLWKKNMEFSNYFPVLVFTFSNSGSFRNLMSVYVFV